MCKACGKVWPRPNLLNDLAVLKLHLEDTGAFDPELHDPDIGEALARVVGALHLSPEEEGWLDRQ